ncbi:hypothetical protein ABK040_001017 [Willaertia magna]
MSKNIFKIAVVGGGGVGKSAITLRLINNTFIEYYDPTIEDSYSKELTVDGKVVKLEILDTAGQDEYQILRDTFMRDNDGFLLVYSITDKHSFEEMENKFIKHIIQCKDGNSNIPMILLGNKCDLDNLRKVTLKEGREFAKKLEIPFFETSAKGNVNILEGFSQLIREMKSFYLESEEDYNEEENDKKEMEKKKKKKQQQQQHKGEKCLVQ